jgi:aerobic-type carbon monoxide dehydrogenase small subunit (CoxS/CutS family)
MQATIHLTVNGQPKSVTTDAERPLLDVLREDLGLTGAKLGCGEGQCGACTVLVDGKAEHSCITPVGDVEGAEILTIEGLGSGDTLDPVQEAFLAEGAVRCGYCTPGMILGAVGLLKEIPEASEAEIVAGMEGHICRCGGYPRIVKAIRRAAAKPGRQQS